MTAACGPRHGRMRRGGRTVGAERWDVLDNLVSRGLGPTVPRLFIADGEKTSSKAIHRTFGSAAAGLSLGEELFPTIERSSEQFCDLPIAARSIHRTVRGAMSSSGSCLAWLDDHRDRRE